MPAFRFEDSGLPASPALTAEVPAGIRTKEGLFEALAQGLHFPDYFGANWNALEECIRDLTWLPVGPVVLRHSDLPISNDVSGLKTYLSILRDAAEKKSSVPGKRFPDLVIVFPSETKERVASLLRSAAQDDLKQ